VAEGVETLGQADIVKSMGARYAQGWAFGRPMTAKNLETFNTRHANVL
jgi:EAL domain-containing protein (putative c-di-GMP-specific phosphodiesterase class I)